MKQSLQKLQEAAKHQKKWYGKWHAWGGITAGFILVIVSLTGALLVFEEELDVWLNPALFDYAEVGQPLLSYGQIEQKLQEARPDWTIQTMVRFPNRNDALYVFVKEKRQVQVIVNPYTGSIAGERIYKYTIMGVIRNLHRTLLIPVVGRYIVGLSSLICVILMITGLRLWIPDKLKQLKARLGIRLDAGKRRINYDLHNSIGLYLSPVITLIALTGVMITFSTIVLGFLVLLSFEPPQSIASILHHHSTPIEGQAPLDLDTLVQRVEQQIGAGHIQVITFPHDSLHTYDLNITEPSILVTGNRYLAYADQYTGALVFTTNTKRLQLGRIYLNWVTPLHYGTFGGLPTRILALLGALATTFLFISGFYIWYGRWKKRQNRAAKRRLRQQKPPNQQSVTP